MYMYMYMYKLHVVGSYTLTILHGRHRIGAPIAIYGNIIQCRLLTECQLSLLSNTWANEPGRRGQPRVKV